LGTIAVSVIRTASSGTALWRFKYETMSSQVWALFVVVEPSNTSSPSRVMVIDISRSCGSLTAASDVTHGPIDAQRSYTFACGR